MTHHGSATAPRRDPTRVREQPALTTSSGREWLLLGGLLALVSLAVLLPLSGMHPDIALVGAGVVLLLLIGMGVVRAAVPRRRARLVTLAVLFGAMAVVALGTVLLVAASTLR
ncbi:hypothetical protein [Leifsonia sp. SIMBA_070]|uniref:hypothetical protein n=1 Tax=Leifsonia sp. SIMBA_070 TaxID=3085810 RepID=UPI0039782519